MAGTGSRAALIPRGGQDSPETPVTIDARLISLTMVADQPGNRLHRKPNKTGGSSDSCAEPIKQGGIVDSDSELSPVRATKKFKL